MDGGQVKSQRHTGSGYSANIEYSIYVPGQRREADYALLSLTVGYHGKEKSSRRNWSLCAGPKDTYYVRIYGRHHQKPRNKHHIKGNWC